MPHSGSDTTKVSIYQEVSVPLTTHDSPQTTITSMFWRMLKEPKLYERLHAALEADFGSMDGDLNIDLLARSPVLNAYIHEALRLDPPLPFFIQRRVPDEGGILSGYVLPANMNVRVSPYQGSSSDLSITAMTAKLPAVQHNEDLWPDAERFNPDRWLNKDSTAFLNPAIQQFFPL